MARGVAVADALAEELVCIVQSHAGWLGVPCSLEMPANGSLGVANSSIDELWHRHWKDGDFSPSAECCKD
eukprot:CAMPEP_0115111452 /NCGR_PEP_ID=MMETSP0227-20121206/40036_1 /TAXON_ID=89957 /ORGANISM="Polarella glacialis, Strain CCMP 1383" /LENGTH=69 /DNA_ID=CAMNT_0002510797 /DNA_START=39 /DNA_END=248 /DNA_ORIENTATION=+